MTRLAVVTGGKRETIADHRKRLLSARARSAELRLAREAGLLVPAQAVKLRWAAIAVTVRNALLGIPSRAKQRLPHLTAADLSVLDELIREALEELARTPTQMTPRQPGERIVGGRLIKDSREQRVSRAITELNRLGPSLRTVVKVLAARIPVVLPR